MLDLDIASTRWINAWAGLFPNLDALMIYASSVGIPILVAAVMIQWWIPRRDPATRHALLAAGLSFLLGLGVNQLILLYLHVERIRPYDADVTSLLIDRSADFSFPSDHATAAFAIASSFWWSGLRGRAFVFLIGAILVSVSRVYVGIHYAGDVLGGAGVGIVSALLVRTVYWKNTRLDCYLAGIL